MERSFIYSYVGNILRWLVRAELHTNDIEAARKWQLDVYHTGEFDKLFKTNEEFRCSELKNLTKQDLIYRIIQLENHYLHKPSIQLLPNETIQKILSKLPLHDLVNSSRVCKRWRRIAHRKFFCKSVDFTNSAIKGGSLDYILSQGTKELKVDNCLSFAPTFAENPSAEYLLESLFLDTNISAETSQYLSSILKRCRRLKKIDLHSVNVTHEICVEISRNVDLRSLSLQAYGGNLHQGLLEIFKSCKRLKTLKYCNQSQPLTEEEIYTLICELPSSIQFLDMFSLQTSLRDHHVALLVRNCPNIVALSLRGCIKITNETIVHLQQLPELQFLNVAWCFGKVNESQRTSRSRSKYLYIGVPFADSLEKLEERAIIVKEEITRMLPGVEVILQP